MFVVFDLDGTLADISHRLHFILGETKDWDAFYAACVDDKPKAAIIETMIAFCEGRHRVEVWSGRSDQVWPQTVQWLNDHVGHGLYEHGLRMRQSKDFTPDTDLKRKWLHQQLALGTQPDLVFEDRQRVVDMWRAEGITCCQVDAWKEG